MSEEDHVNYQTDDRGIATITFEHPLHNALPGNLLQKLALAIFQAGEDKIVKVIVLKSGGDRTFCAGASFDELSSISNAEEGLQFFSGFADVINACRKNSKLIIGRVQGKAVGGGVGVAAATDYCFATREASVKLSELSLGIGPFVVGPAIERKTGRAAFGRMAIQPEKWMAAEWAHEQGLYQEVFDSVEALDSAVEQLAIQLSSYDPAAMQALKKVLWEGTDHWDELLKERAALSGKLVLSDFTRNALDKSGRSNRHS